MKALSVALVVIAGIIASVFSPTFMEAMRDAGGAIVFIVILAIMLIFG